MPLTGRPMLSTIGPSAAGGMVSRITFSTRSQSAAVSSMRVPVGARTCSFSSALSTGGKKSWPRNGAKPNEAHDDDEKADDETRAGGERGRQQAA